MTKETSKSSKDGSIPSKEGLKLRYCDTCRYTGLESSKEDWKLMGKGRFPQCGEHTVLEFSNGSMLRTSKERGIDEVDSPAATPAKCLRGEPKAKATEDANPKGGGLEDVEKEHVPPASKAKRWSLSCHQAKHLAKDCKTILAYSVACDHWGWQAAFKKLNESEVLERCSKPPTTVKELMYHLQFVTFTMEELQRDFVVRRDQVIKAISDNDDLMKRVEGRVMRPDNDMEEYAHYYSQAACLTNDFIERVYAICNQLFGRLVVDQAKGVKRVRNEDVRTFRARLTADVATNHPQNYPFKMELVDTAVADIKKAHINYVR